ncbi:hypothetical protein NE865_01456 [Phthorimaea operculella]|nr:hypothetical protein NE865_01456 [Phthorimaea operculella]
MAPREEKVTPKVNRTIARTSTTKKPFLSSSTVKKTITTVKKTMVMSSNTVKNTITKSSTTVKKTNTVVDQTPRKVEPRQRTNTAPTPKVKEAKPATCPGSVTKSAKKAYNRRPKPAHSGVPVPEKMKRILQQQLQDSDSSLIL